MYLKLWFEKLKVSMLLFFFSLHEHRQLGQYLSGLLSLFSMLFLGFVDDVLDIRWRVKIWMPLFASIPLLMVYFVTYNGTSVVVPVPFRALIGSKIVDLGIRGSREIISYITKFESSARNYVLRLHGCSYDILNKCY